MHRTKLLVFGAAIGALALSTLAFGDPARTTAATSATTTKESLTVDTIVQRHLAALGGEKLLRGGKSFSFTISGEKMGKAFTKSVTYARPDRFRVDIVSAEGPVSKGFDGKVAWFKKGTAPAELVPAEEMANVKKHADFEEPLLDYAKKGTTVKLVGTTEVDSRPAYDLEVTFKGGDVEHHFLDARSFLLVKRTFTGKDKDGKAMQSVIRFGDYKKVQGRMVNHSVTWEDYDGKQSRSTVSKVSFDKPVDAKIFAMPK